MAYVTKGYIGDSSVNKKMGNTSISNGVVQKAYGGVGTPGNTNLRDNGYYNTYPTTGSTTTTSDRPKTGGSGSGSRSKSSSSSSSNMANAYNALLAAYRQNDYSDYLRQMREAAQTAYDRGMGALNSAYDNQMNSLSDNLNETRNQLTNQYNRSRDNINQDAENSLRQAYINNMMSRRNLGQQMSALGLNGGATETNLANMANNYGNARNNINTTLNNNLSNLEGNYSDNLSQAQQAYNSAVASANLQKAQQAMSLENALANNQISALGDYQTLMQRENQNYLDLLKAAIANGASFSYNPTEANNAFNAVAVNQAANPNLVNNLTAIQELMGAENTPGVTMPGVTVVNPATQTNYLQQILSQLRG
jgi:hypothetical protein